MTTERIPPQVAYVKGRILHAGTGRPVVGDVRITAAERRVVGKVFDDGRFVVSAYERYDELHLDIHATSKQFSAGAAKLSVLVTLDPGDDFDPEPPASPDPLKDLGDILLPQPPDKTYVRGRVVRADDPEVPIVNAQVKVELGSPPAILLGSDTTDAEGRYRLDDMEIIAPATVTCSAVGFKTEARALLVDFGRAVNVENFRLQTP